MEIERRWLVEGWPQQEAVSTLEMEQGYFCTRPAVRIRREAVQGGTTAYVLCFKGKGGLSREEIELPLSPDHYTRLKAMLDRPMIEKQQRRYALPGGYTRASFTPRWNFRTKPRLWPGHHRRNWPAISAMRSRARTARAWLPTGSVPVWQTKKESRGRQPRDSFLV